MLREAVRPAPGRVLPRPVVLRVVRQDGSTVANRPIPRRPAWWLLYGIGALTVGVLWAAEILLAEGPPRTWGELLTVSGGMVLMRLWVGCNRWRLAQTEAQRRAQTPPQGADASSGRPTN